jgi:hypothetical protein
LDYSCISWSHDKECTYQRLHPEYGESIKKLEWEGEGEYSNKWTGPIGPESRRTWSGTTSILAMKEAMVPPEMPPRKLNALIEVSASRYSPFVDDGPMDLRVLLAM